MSIIYGGHDEHLGFQLYQSDPSGNYAGWKATIMGSNAAAGQSILKAEYQEGCSLRAASLLALKVLKKTMAGSAALKAEKGCKILALFSTWNPPFIIIFFCFFYSGNDDIEKR